MAVIVYPTPPNPNATSKPETYEKGEKVRVGEGHLYVTGADVSDTLAVYSPGTWHHTDVK